MIATKCGRRLLDPNGLRHSLEEILEQDVRFECASGLTRHDHERTSYVERVGHRRDLSGIGRIEHAQGGETLDVTERRGKHIRAQARSAHPEQQDIGESTSPHGFGDRAQPIEILELIRRDTKPPEPSILVGPGPQRGIACPQPLSASVRLPVRSSTRPPRRPAEVASARAAASPIDGRESARFTSIAASNFRNASANMCTPSSTSRTVMLSSEMPAASRAESTACASSVPASRLCRARPWSLKASSVTGGIVLTVSGPINSST